LQTETAIDLNAYDSLIDPLTLLFIVKPPKLAVRTEEEEKEKCLDRKVKPKAV